MLFRLSLLTLFFSLSFAQNSIDSSEILLNEAQLTISGIDLKHKKIRFKNQSGEEKTFQFENARNLDQIEVGDQVQLRQTEQVSIHLLPNGSVMKGQIIKDRLISAEPGKKPYVILSHHVELTGQIKSIDQKKGRMIIEIKSGQIIRPITDTDKIKVGQMVRIHYVEKLTIRVFKSN